MHDRPDETARTQTELAEKTGTPQAQVSRIDNAVVSRTSPTLAKLAEALGADLQLVEGSLAVRRRAVG